MVLTGTGAAQRSDAQIVPPSTSTDAPATTLEAAVAAVADLCNWDEATALLGRIDPLYRLRGNEGHLQTLEHIFVQLRDAGFSEGGAQGGDVLEFIDLGPPAPAWTPLHARLAIESPSVGVLHEFARPSDGERTFLCPNSFPTPPEGILAPLARYELGKPPEVYAGTIVFGERKVEDLFEHAVQQGGALGVISSYLSDFNAPDEHTDAIRFAAIPYDAGRRAFGLNVSPAKRRVLERLLASGSVYVRVTIGARFADARGRTLVANIGGTDPDAGTIVLSTTADEPGGNNNGSGAVTTAAIAAGYLRAIRDGRLERPRRSIAFLFAPEIEGSQEWLKTRPGKVDLALCLDMVGQDPALTGATALVERMPDPGAIWDRPPLDIHSQWGRGDVRESDLMGSFLNDYVMAAMEFRAQAAGWNVRSNPYEGGSDQGSFLQRGIPAVLLWHFTDPFYDTNLDRADKVSRAEMANVATATLGLVHHFGHAGIDRALEVLAIVMIEARQRLLTEANNAQAFLDVAVVAQDEERRKMVLDREQRILLAWGRWYRQAVLSLEGFDPQLGFADRARLEEGIDAALGELRQIEMEALESLQRTQ